MSNLCPQCGAPVEAGTQSCQYCGATIATQGTQNQGQPQVIVQQVVTPATNSAISSAWPIKSKIVAGILALLLGGLGIHKFYLGNTKSGILYLLFCWTYIPGIVSFIEGIIILCSNDENFQLKYHVRLQ